MKMCSTIKKPTVSLTSAARWLPTLSLESGGPGRTWRSNMSFYRKRPVVVEAVQLTQPTVVSTPEGDMKGAPGDWLITGVKGEKYPCSPITFNKTYEHVSGRRFRKRPLVVDAIRLAHRVAIETEAGTLVGKPGDWFIDGVDGSQYPCDPTVFEDTYEVVSDPGPDLSSA